MNHIFEKDLIISLQGKCKEIENLNLKLMGGVLTVHRTKVDKILITDNPTNRVRHLRNIFDIGGYNCMEL